MTLSSAPLLKVIDAKIARHVRHASSDERALAREARLVLTARASQELSGSNEALESGDSLAAGRKKGRETYQEALRLLQDPIVPVRAHGLILLSQLVAAGDGSGPRPSAPSCGLTDPALEPAILDIFIQAVQNDESFLYLNAVKGLASLANSGGRRMLRRLVSTYVGDLRGAAMQQTELDMRLRVGEALLQVVQRQSQALAQYCTCPWASGGTHVSLT
jgi:hypothetical protein